MFPPTSTRSSALLDSTKVKILREMAIADKQVKHDYSGPIKVCAPHLSASI